MAVRENYKVFGALFLICLAELIFLSRTAPVFFDGDAFFYFVNPIENLEGLKKLFTSVDQAGQYRPLGAILFSYVFYPVFKLNPGPYSTTALFFHVLNTALICLILRRLVKKPIGVIAGTVFWGINPTAIYVTHSFSFLADFTYGFFYFLGLLAFLLYVDHGKKRYAILLFVSFLLALMSKEAAVTLPALLLLITFSFFMQKESWSQILPKIRPIFLILFVLIALYLVFYSSLKNGRLYDPDQKENYHFSFSVSSLQNKVDHILAALYLPFPDAVEAQDIDFKTERLVLLVFPLFFLLLAYVLLQFKSPNNNAVIGILWFLICASPVLFINPSEFMHNLYVPCLGLSVIVGFFFYDVDRYIRKMKMIRPEFLYIYVVCVVVISILTNQKIFLATNWRVYYEQVARNTIRDMKILHPTLAPGTILFILRSSVPQIQWITYDGKLFNVFYGDNSIRSVFAGRDQTLPLEEAKAGKVRVLAYTDDHLFDISSTYIKDKLNSKAYRLFDDYKYSKISFINEHSALDPPPATPNKKPVFIAPVLRNGEIRNCLITIADGRIRFKVPQLGKDSKLIVGVAKKFDIGNGAEGRIYFEHGDDRELIYSKALNPSSKIEDRKWFDESIDLSKFHGKTGFLAFECYPGKDGDAVADWFGWSKLQLIGAVTPGGQTGGGNP